MNLRYVNNVDSKEFEDAVLLGDKNSKTLGFLPKMAFKSYASSNKLIGAFDRITDNLIGYILYRTSYNKVTIVHLCVDENYRNKGVAKKLVDFLKSNTQNYKGIRLSCRNDYEINKVWEKFNFIPIDEKAGRGKDKKLLTIWWFPHGQTNLFSQVEDYELKNKITAVIDMNIFLDIKDCRNEEGLALESDWILNVVNFYITREIYNEINRNQDNKTKESSRSFTTQFHELPFDEFKFNEIFNEIKDKVKIQNENDKSDVKHISHAISAGAEYFITQDSEILKNKDFFLKYGIQLFRPGQFICELDELMQSSKYKPQDLIGTSLKTINLSGKELDSISSIFLSTNTEKKNDLKRKLSNYLAHPNKFELISVIKNNEIIAMFVLDRSEDNLLSIPLFRFKKNNLQNTLSKHILFKIIQTATDENRAIIEISDQFLDSPIIGIINETKFIKRSNKWVKYNMKGVVSKATAIDKLVKLNPAFKFEESYSKMLDNEQNKSLILSTEVYNLERSLYPVKIEELSLPCYIVPIKPEWAEALIIDNSQKKLPLIEPDYPLLLNRENVYYRSEKPAVIQAPARILWYVSGNKNTKQKGCIVASSYIDEVFIDEAKNLFKRFEKLGVYKWSQIERTSNKNKQLMAFIFSDTEKFKYPISYDYLKSYFPSKENKNFMIITPFEIQKETYLDLYQKGMQL